MATPEQRMKEQCDAEAQAAEKLESAKLDDAIRKNLEGLGYGG